MSKTTTPVILLCLMFWACSQVNTTSKEAEAQLPVAIAAWAKDPTSVKLKDIKTMYTNDSLSILHANVMGKNGLGHEVTNRIEYVYLNTEGNIYDAVCELTDDSVYQDIETWEKTKNEKIYKKLDYDNALAYRAIMCINENGRDINDKFNEKSVNLRVPTNTGRWKLHTTTDKFGEKTNVKYLTVIGEGKFSNSATSGSRLSVVLFWMGESCCIRLLEYGTNVAKDGGGPYEVRIKDGNGKEYPLMLFYNDEADGDICPLDLTAKTNNTIKDILEKGGDVTFSVKYDKYTFNSYQFKVNVDGFSDAVKFL